MRKILSVLFLSGLLSLVSGNYLFADENTAPAPSDNGELTKKLNRIAEDQAEIIKKLDEIKSELQIVKVRASEG